jgi:hypothetical protein
MVDGEDIRIINKYKFTLSTIRKALRYLQSGNGDKKKINFLSYKKDKWSYNKGKLYFDDRLIIPREMMSEYLINLYLEGYTGRDELHKEIMSKYIGISRGIINKFLSEIKKIT